MKRGWIMAILLAVSLATPGAVRAAEIEKLLMPGKVSTAHAKTEAECSACHDRIHRERQNELCSACHKPVAADIARHAGFHGRAAVGKECSSCHSEHLGRDGDIVRMNRVGFDHSRTDFRLTGGHIDASCESCHKAGRKFRDAPSLCVDCHAQDEPHDGKLGRKCADCHVTESWRTAKFDHDKTRFALKGRHVGVDCDACHIDNRYKDTPMQCVACHAPDDVHRGGRGPKCESCHTVEGWKKSRFDHERETGFALTGTHSRLQCQDCHRQADFKDKPPKTCSGCHASDDSHAGRFGRECGDCHGNEHWKPVDFDHEKRAHYPLEGKHADVACHACHTAVVVKNAPQRRRCVACHKVDDPHAGKLGDSCETCHNATGWHEKVRFDHDLTRFPLVGMHATVPCGNCHRTRDFAAAPHECIACHRSDDQHDGSLGERCHDCHNPNSWALWDFDHGKATKFALDGAHAKLACGDCHRESPDKVKPSMDCIACHQADDVHFGRFGRQCARCHETTSFRRVRRH